MGDLRAHGISCRLPGGFAGRIFVRKSEAGAAAAPVAQFATFVVPRGTGDFGGGAVGLMRPDDIFAVLFEYGQESVGARLFSKGGMPRDLTVAHFSPTVLRRGLPGQSGTQWFFTEGGRPFTFYAVLGSHARRQLLVPRVNALLAGLSVEPVATGVPWN
jgi:hypothetical protein